MRTQFFDTAAKRAVTLDEILEPVFATADGEIERSTLHAYIEKQVAEGALEMTPSARQLQAMAIDATVDRWLHHARDENQRRFVPNRAGRVSDTRVSNAIAFDSARNEAYLQSVRRYLFTEGPAAYRSQAQLLLALDPTVERETLAQACGAAVRDAVASLPDAVAKDDAA